jgi:hypothetical protein
MAKMNPLAEVEVDLPFIGKTIARIIVDEAFTMEFGDGDRLRIECAFVLSTEAGRYELSPAVPKDLCPALELLGKSIKSASARKGGMLDTEFADGTRMQVDADSRFEAWEAVGQAGFRVVCMPGGEFAIWQTVSRRK